MNSLERRKQLRKSAAHIRDSIPPVERARLSAQISQHVIDWLKDKPINVVMLYLNMRSEVETTVLWDFLLGHGKIALAPVVEASELTPYRVKDTGRELKRHAYGMLEPDTKICAPFPPTQIDLVLVPGLAFDRQGYRIGYGGGYYDRFLPRCPQATWVGLAYEAQLVADIFPEAWDIRLHHICTERGFLTTQAAHSFR